MKKTFLILLVLILFFPILLLPKFILSEEQNVMQHRFRPLSDYEIKLFIPHRYRLVQWLPNTWYSSESQEMLGAPIDINLDDDKDDEVILFLESMGGLKIIALDYDGYLDRWQILDEYEPLLNNDNKFNFGIVQDYHTKIYDVNNDGIQELQLSMMFYAGGSHMVIRKAHLTVQDGQIVDLLPLDANTNVESDEFIIMYEDDYYVISFIRGEGESQKDKHYFAVNKYSFDLQKNKYELVRKYRTKQKYPMNISNSEGDELVMLVDSEKLLNMILEDVRLDIF